MLHVPPIDIHVHIIYTCTCKCILVTLCMYTVQYWKTNTIVLGIAMEWKQRENSIHTLYTVTVLKSRGKTNWYIVIGTVHQQMLVPSLWTDRKLMYMHHEITTPNNRWVIFQSLSMAVSRRHTDTRHTPFLIHPPFSFPSLPLPSSINHSNPSRFLFFEKQSTTQLSLLPTNTDIYSTCSRLNGWCTCTNGLEHAWNSGRVGREGGNVLSTCTLANSVTYM